jgi:predicted glycosyltransferase
VSGRRVFFYVQHLLGIGHLRRAATLSRALARAGFDVLLVSGGASVPDLEVGSARFHQLPPLRARDEGLRELVQLDGAPLDDAMRARRVRALVDLVRAEAPGIVITEQFPFGRTQLRFELLPLLEAAHRLPRRPHIVSSVRDVLRDTARPERIAETLATFDAFFDAVLVHADPALVGLDKSFAGWAHIENRAHYTGYIVDDEAPSAFSADAGQGEVIVSAGGGAVGGPLLRAALAARPLTTLAERPWRLLLGGNLAEAEQAMLRARADAGITIEAARADFPALLARSALSISQAGYNTVVETLVHGDRAVLVPFATARETEQTRRAQLLAERGLVQMVPADRLDGQALADAAERALASPSIRSFPACDANGGSATAQFLARIA